jgi:hypothetical protein
LIDLIVDKSGLQDIIITNTLNETLSVINNEHILALIDSSITEIWLPRSVCDRFESALGLQFHEASDRYALADATRNRLLQLNPTFTFTINTNAVTGGNTCGTNPVCCIRFAGFLSDVR